MKTTPVKIEEYEFEDSYNECKVQVITEDIDYSAAISFKFDCFKDCVDQYHVKNVEVFNIEFEELEGDGAACEQYLIDNINEELLIEHYLKTL